MSQRLLIQPFIEKRFVHEVKRGEAGEFDHQLEIRRRAAGGKRANLRQDISSDEHRGRHAGPQIEFECLLQDLTSAIGIGIRGPALAHRSPGVDDPRIGIRVEHCYLFFEFPGTHPVVIVQQMDVLPACGFDPRFAGGIGASVFGKSKIAYGIERVDNGGGVSLPGVVDDDDFDPVVCLFHDAPDGFR